MKEQDKDLRYFILVPAFILFLMAIDLSLLRFSCLETPTGYVCFAVVRTK